MPILAITAFSVTAAESDTRAVQAEFSRCESAFERVKRELSRYEETVRRIKASLDAGRTREHEGDLSQLESKLEYFRGRIDRATGQGSKIRDDLRNVTGPTCPSCLSSSVSVYCRAGEGLATEIEDYLSRAATLDGDLRNSSPHGARKAVSTDSAFVHRRNTITTSLALNQAILDSCSVDAGRTLLKQCRINLHAADSLRSSGAVERSERSLGLAEMLLDKAIKRCGGE